MRKATGSRKKIVGLWGLLLLQGFCALFFLADAATDLMGLEQRLGRRTDIFEAVVVVALILGLVFTALEIRQVIQRQRRMEDQLRAASGAFADLLEENFETWGLTPSERDVAVLTIKGVSIAETARLRNTKEGTVKAQCNAIYRKAGVSGRTQLLSMFVEELMTSDRPLTDR